MSTATKSAPAKAAVATETEGDFLDQVLSQTTGKVEQVIQRYTEETDSDAVSQLRRNVMTGMAIRKLRSLLTADFMRLLTGELMNSPLGFMTDRGPHVYVKDEQKDGWKQKPYADDVVRDAAIQALLHGLSWCNNEFNIISKRCYITQAGYERKVRETPGLTDLSYGISPSEVMKGVQGRCVRACASWKKDGRAEKLVGTDGKDGLVIAIKSDDYSSEDQINGKALRKMLARVFRLANGSLHSLPDPDTEPGEAAPVVAAEAPPVKTDPPPETTQPPRGDQRFVEDMGTWDARFIREGYRCNPGDFLDALLTTGVRAGWPAKLEHWPTVLGAIRSGGRMWVARSDFCAEVKDKFKLDHPKPAAKAEKPPADPDDAELAGDDIAAQLRDLLFSAALREADLLKYLNRDAATKLSDLTMPEARIAVAWLEPQAAATATA